MGGVRVVNTGTAGSHVTAERLLAAAATNTPLRRIEMSVAGRTHRAWLKLEMANPTGSVKYRTALGLLTGLQRRRPLSAGTTLIESTSGNLGVALAHLTARFGGRFIAVVDPKAPPMLVERMRGLGTELVRVHTPDQHGGYLLSRLERVETMLRADPELRWTDQYHSPDGPGVHRDVTAPELAHQTGGRIDALFAAVSTGGTLAGLGEGLSKLVAGIGLYPVDVQGSIALGGAAHPHLLNGIGATRRSSLLTTRALHAPIHVPDARAIALCRMLDRQTGIALGASSGAVVAAYLTAVADGGSWRCPVLISPDGGDHYRHTVYSDDWLEACGRLDAVRAVEDAAAADRITFTVTGDVCER